MYASLLPQYAIIKSTREPLRLFSCARAEGVYLANETSTEVWLLADYWGRGSL